MRHHLSHASVFACGWQTQFQVEAPKSQPSIQFAAPPVLQVGTWKGLSASHLAGYLKLRRSGVLLCVDTWVGALEFWNRRFSRGSFDPNRNLHWKNGWPTVYYRWAGAAHGQSYRGRPAPAQQLPRHPATDPPSSPRPAPDPLFLPPPGSFLSNMAHLNLTEYVVPFPVPSTLAATFIGENANWRPDMLHIDAAHEYNDIKEDIQVGRPCLSLSGHLPACCWQLARGGLRPSTVGLA